MESADKIKLRNMKDNISEKKHELSQDVVDGRASMSKAVVEGAYNIGVPTAVIKTAAVSGQNLMVGIVGSDKAIVEHYRNYNSVANQSDAMVVQAVADATNRSNTVAAMQEKYASEKAQIEARDRAARFAKASTIADGIVNDENSSDKDGMTADYLNI